MTASRHRSILVGLCVVVLVMVASSSAFGAVITNVTATASSVNSPDEGPEKTVDGSGISAGAHSTNSRDMWLSDREIGPSIQYTFDGTYLIDGMHVWNHNTGIEMLLGFGIQDALIDYSADLVHWSTLGTHTFARAPGNPSYAGFDVDLGGITAQAVRITAQSTHGNLGMGGGLSEVQFSGEPAGDPGTPTPAVPVPGAFLLASFGAGVVACMRRRQA